MEGTTAELERAEDFELDSYFDFEVVQEDGFFFDQDDDQLLGLVIGKFDEYPTEETRLELFDQALLEAIMKTQECDEEDAQEILEEIDELGEDELPEYDIAERFSLFFTVEGHAGLYRMMMYDGECWVGHSTGKRNARWSL